MKKVFIRKVALNDFKDFRGLHEFKLEKAGLGVHYVTGDNQVDALGANGASKSTIFDALCFCLFGKTALGLGAVDVKPWFVSKPQTSVCVDLDVDGKYHAIERAVKTNGLRLDGDLCDQTTIDKLLGYNMDVFCNTILFAQGQPLFFDLEPGAKMALLSTALDLDRWERRAKAANDKAKEHDGAVDELRNTLLGIKAQAEQLDRQILGWEAKRDSWIQDEQAATKELNLGLRKALASLKFHEAEVGKQDLLLDGNETELKASRIALAAARKKLDKAFEERAETIARRESCVRELEGWQQEVRETGDKCSTCGQSLKGTALAKHAAALKSKIRLHEKALRGWDEQLKRRQLHYSTQDAAVKKLAKECDTFSNRADDAREALTRAERAKATAAADVKNLKADLAKAEKAVNPYDAMIRDANKALRKLDKQEADIMDTEIKLLAIVAATKAWQKHFRVIRLHSLEEVLAELTATTAALLPQFGLEKWKIVYEMERETKAGKFIDKLDVMIGRTGSPRLVKWKSYSGGELQRLRLIGAVALSQVLLRRIGIASNLLIFDEPTQHLSAEGVADTIDVLLELGEQASVFYVDHMARPTSRFASTTRIVKTDKGAAAK